MTFNLLANAANIVFICVIVALLVAFFVWSFISNKKKQKNFNDTINAVKPGSKVKTIGGVCGEVVEIDDEENTFVLKTGTSDGSGVSYLKFDKQAIYQTDAKPEPKAEEPVKEEKSAKEEKAEEPFEEGKTEEKPAEAPAEEKDEKKE
ncbi:MAG TPA: preprotein translocase subunit YajC [Candidatus Borkfalkia avistercoris]|uniref:Preprotein translocase subunit YajC n=1 Tax=Candidatus Borkfalkia avistercoris TaxID=2838504 RepID=A0A9D2CX04_9FIRM|nr:preprotein translocase subunit YajC [Candidatus Borkfalkia avistercoris]